MANITFFTAISFEDRAKSTEQVALENVDDYFYLGGTKAVVLQGKVKKDKTKTILLERSTSRLLFLAKVISYFTIIIPLVMLTTKAILRSRNRFYLVDPQKKLGKGINLNTELIEKIGKLFPKIERGEEDENIEWLSKGNNHVFKLNNYPDLVFKTARGENPNLQNEFRFKMMIEAKKIVVALNLDLLVVPHAKKFEVVSENKKFTLIVEEVLDFFPDERGQEELYALQADKMHKTVHQLATFIAKTGFNDVTWRNIPILKEKEDNSGPKKIGLIDLESMHSRFNGFMGDSNGSCGLIQCIAPQLIDSVVDEAAKQGIDLPSLEVDEVKKSGIKKLESIEKIHRTYEIRKINRGNEPINVDLESLGINLKEESEEYYVRDHQKKGFVKMKMNFGKFAEIIIAEINKKITENYSEKASIKGNRYFALQSSGFDYFPYNPNTCKFYSEEVQSRLWLPCLLKALMDKEYIFSYKTAGCLGYAIQA